LPSRINTTALQLAPSQPFHFAATVYSHGWVGLAPNHWDRDNKTWQRVEQLGSGKVVLIAARGSRSVKRPSIDLEVAHPGRLTQREQADIVARVGHMLRIDEDFSEFHRLCATRGERWAQVSHGAGRLLRSSHLFEDLVKTLCTTNIQWSGTRRMVENLVNEFGAAYAGDPLHKAFPSAQAIAAVPFTEFKAAVNMGYRSAYVHLLATRIASGELDLDTLCDAQLSTQEVKRRLLAIKGIGNYAAATLLMLLGRYDQLPVDSVFRQFVSKNYFAGAEVSDIQAQEIYLQWGDWKYLAYWHDLWQEVPESF
jgi:3-methyladenine DNA glycosylase/8-oxoguanine DNA glycosylase